MLWIVYIADVLGIWSFCDRCVFVGVLSRAEMRVSQRSTIRNVTVCCIDILFIMQPDDTTDLELLSRACY